MFFFSFSEYLCDIDHTLCEGYPDDEAASLESLKYRQREANSLFVGYYEDSVLYAVSCLVCCLSASKLVISLCMA